jgi:hypothetical protein
MNRCRSCGAPILWARTEKGKKEPIDLEPNPKGNIILREREGSEARAIHGVPDEVWPDEPRHTSHFATCPNAAEWRRRTIVRQGA